MAAYEIDHLFVFVSFGGVEADRLAATCDGYEPAAARVWSPYDLSVIDACRAVAGVCPIRFAEGPEPLLELWFDEYASDVVTDLRPDLPLVIHPARS